MFGRMIYFLLIGWWFGALVAAAAYVLCITVIGLPLGLILFNRLPTLMTMRDPQPQTSYGYDYQENINDIPFILRVIWFFVLGWELGLLALIVGYCLCLSLIGIPLGLYVLNRLPLILTLSRKYD